MGGYKGVYKMREIKFRAWDIEHKKMMYSGKKREEFFFHIEESDGALREWARLMQFTGLKDKKGKEIYEGDIVKFQQQLFEIKLWNGSYCLWKIDRVAWYFHQVLGRDFEIVGNIYENPELGLK